MDKVGLLVAATIAVGAAVLGSYGFRGREVLVGVDLGTTYSAVGYKTSGPQGPIQILRDARNKTTTPSVLALSRDGDFILGAPARVDLSEEPWRGVFDSKRLMGRTWEDPITQEEVARHAYHSVAVHPTAYRNRFGKDAKLGGKHCSEADVAAGQCWPDVAFVVQVPAAAAAAAAKHRCIDANSVYPVSELERMMTERGVWGAEEGGEEGSSGRLLHVPPSDDTALLLTPTASACLLLTHMSDQLKKALGHSQVKSVVAAVPADFSGVQRAATVSAYERAGLRVSRVLHEPAAAALAYGLHTSPDTHFVLVFDMGGGTLDVSILYLQNGAFTLIGSAGDGHLGGEDFDDCVLDIMVRQLKEQDGYDIETEAEPDAPAASAGGAATSSRSLAQSRGECTRAWLKSEAERVKIALDAPSRKAPASTGVSAPWYCVLPCSGRLVHHKVTKAQFEAQCAPVFDRILVPVTSALVSANVSAAEVDEIVLVGGSSRLPQVHDLLRAAFPGKTLHYTVDPDLAVATGAAAIVD